MSFSFYLKAVFTLTRSWMKHEGFFPLFSLWKIVFRIILLVVLKKPILILTYMGQIKPRCVLRYQTMRKMLQNDPISMCF